MVTTTAARGRRRMVNGMAPPHPAVRGLKGIVLALCCAVVIVPFLSVVATSLADQEQITRAGGYVLWPQDPTFDAYAAIFRGGVVTRATLVSIGVTLVGSLLSVAVVALLAYSLSRPGSFGSRPVLMLVLVTLLFNAGMIPNYLLIKQLGLIDSWWALILPPLVSAFQVIIVRAFFLEVPKEIVDAARIDGAGELQILTRIMLPLSKAVLAVVALFQAVAYWSAFFNALLYLNSTEKWPLQLVLRTYVVDNAAIGTDLPGEVVPPQQSLQMAILVVSLVPILLVYPFLQKHFAKGVVIGAVKG
ncbi:carbohydrate ABC transporter permease [Plantactinospora sp. KLBMP9567]|jgi:multiple sugar transport system permease protein/putative aldouronate transport system permease protein|uniref:carbohydrate ABC transporter permease n=1 Tax=Plantactinospora sp. KLBMP9567 TaxID=3085900 RepID=UPI002980E9F4|nr:carbohydrate ABC transporter permease [Plantactinospora sp. KLBMP9567]MDW5325779.1 carbohydrate ABC transporter permease [Plantactinospora sp. KLBMP9567]